MDIKEQLKELEAIAKEACAIGYEELGTGWNDLTPDIRVYTADSVRRHQAANICGVDVGLFSPAQFTFDIYNAPQLGDIISEGKTQLSSYKALIEDRDSAEMEKKKQDKIASLKQQLSDLEDN